MLIEDFSQSHLPNLHSLVVDLLPGRGRDSLLILRQPPLIVHFDSVNEENISHLYPVIAPNADVSFVVKFHQHRTAHSFMSGGASSKHKGSSEHKTDQN